MEIQSRLALTPCGTVHTLTPNDIAAKEHQLDKLEKDRREK
jgi:hypothetical protein